MGQVLVFLPKTAKRQKTESGKLKTKNFFVPLQLEK
jgi:hypothetical protein